MKKVALEQDFEDEAECGLLTKGCEKELMWDRRNSNSKGRGRNRNWCGAEGRREAGKAV